MQNQYLKNKNDSSPTILKLTSNDTFKLIISEKIENKIRYLNRESPYKEWSGVLFYSILEGDIEDVSKLVLKAEDLWLLDLGSEVFTSFEFPVSLSIYIANNPDLMLLQQGIIHSHHNMKAFFSGTDDATLYDFSSEIFNTLSLIVNNAGTYVAALAVNTVTTVKDTGKRQSDKIVNKFNHTSVKSIESTEYTVEKTINSITKYNAIIEHEIPYVDEELEAQIKKIRKEKEDQDKKASYTHYTHTRNQLNIPYLNNREEYEDEDYKEDIRELSCSPNDIDDTDNIDYYYYESIIQLITGAIPDYSISNKDFKHHILYELIRVAEETITSDDLTDYIYDNILEMDIQYSDYDMTALLQKFAAFIYNSTVSSYIKTSVIKAISKRVPSLNILSIQA